MRDPTTLTLKGAPACLFFHPHWTIMFMPIFAKMAHLIILVREKAIALGIEQKEKEYFFQIKVKS